MKAFMDQDFLLSTDTMRTARCQTRANTSVDSFSRREAVRTTERYVQFATGMAASTP